MQALIKQGNKSERRHLGIQNREPKERDIYNLLLLAPLDSKYSVQSSDRENSRNYYVYAFFKFFDHLPTYSSVDAVFTKNMDKKGSFWTTYPPDLVHVGEA